MKARYRRHINLRNLPEKTQQEPLDSIIYRRNPGKGRIINDCRKARHHRNRKLKGQPLENFMRLITTPDGIYKLGILNSMCDTLEAF